MGCSLADFEELVSATSGRVYGRVCGQKFWVRFPDGPGFAWGVGKDYRGVIKEYIRAVIPERTALQPVF